MEKLVFCLAIYLLVKGLINFYQKQTQEGLIRIIVASLLALFSTTLFGGFLALIMTLFEMRDLVKDDYKKNPPIK